jgi:hypothetical protein
VGVPEEGDDAIDRALHEINTQRQYTEHGGEELGADVRRVPDSGAGELGKVDT